MSWYSPPGDYCKVEELENRRAIALADAVGWHPLAVLKTTRWQSVNGRRVEFLVVDIEVELPQDLVNNITDTETLMICVDDSDERCPEVLAMRKAFPIVPHLNLAPANAPRDLCIYELPWADKKLNWSAAEFILDISGWLQRTAVGELHDDDQPLEPFLLGDRWVVVLSPEIFSPSAPKLPIRIIECNSETSAMTVLRVAPAPEGEPSIPKWASALCIGEPTEHGVIEALPKNLAELAVLLETAGIDLLKQLEVQLEGYSGSVHVPEAGVLLLVQLPRLRRSGQEPMMEYWVFLLSSVEHVLEATGKFAPAPETGNMMPLLSQANTSGLAEKVEVTVLRPMFEVTAEAANHYSGLSNNVVSPRVTLVGAGALGSQIHENLSKMGWGKWSVIDDDLLLPHNIVRHRLGYEAIGFGKAEALLITSQAETPYCQINRAIQRDVLSLSPDQPDYSALTEADLLLDVSTSISVARFLTQDCETEARRVSSFLSPSGKDAVMLAEHAQRAVKMGALEAQYYRAVLSDSRLAEHLKGADTSRYGGGCRDVSVRMGQDDVATFAGVLAKQIRQLDSEPRIAIWRNQENGGINYVEVEVSAVSEQIVNGWNISIDDGMLAGLRERREALLPSETGGVLLGLVDQSRNTIHIVDGLPAPEDSVEFPHSFVRGCAGLPAVLQNVEKQTGGQVRYVGEWHSHPHGAGVGMSTDDVALLEEMADEVRASGLPGLMVIIGDQDYGVYCNSVN